MPTESSVLSYRVYSCSTSTMEERAHAKTIIADKKRATTADADNKRQSKQFRLITTLRKLIIASAEMSNSITSSDKTLSADTVSPAKTWVSLRHHIRHTKTHLITHLPTLYIHVYTHFILPIDCIL